MGAGNGPGIPQLWWIDPAKQSKLEQALRDPSIKLDVGPDEDRYWLQVAKKEKSN